MRGPSDILFVQATDRADHLPGVRDELAVRGLTSARQDEPFARPRVYPGTRVVVVTDLVSGRCREALRQAAGVGARTVLLMDGLTEWRNTFANPRVPDRFLRPAPVDLVLCAGLSDARVLRALGNRATPTGLPRVDAGLRDLANLGDPRRVLVATANTPAFTVDERSRIVTALGELRESAERAGWTIAWRLTGALEDDLGVANDEGTLASALARSGAVITTPSTLMVESMRAGLPTALLRLHGEPLWHSAAWVWEPDESPEPIDDPSDVPEGPRGMSRWVDSADRLLRQLARPTREQLDRQAECLRWLDASSDGVPPAELVAEAIAGEAAVPAAPVASPLVPPSHRLPARVPKHDCVRRVVSVVVIDESPVGGVTTHSQRLARAAARRPELGYDVRTLLVAWDVATAHRARELLDETTSLCIVDRYQPAHRVLDHLRRSIERLEPDLLLPNYTDAAHMVAAQFRREGVRCLGIGHTDDESYRELLLHSEWDGAVAVSDSIRAWLDPLAGDRPRDTIVYGVPVSSAPRTIPDYGRLEIASIGRVQQPQKRAMDLVPLVEQTASLGVEATLHVVGDGPALPALRRALGAGTGSVRVRFHGARDAAWVERFLPSIDVSLLVSEAEGTSLSMLEAMGAGVVPAVTEVSSGVGEWIEDGVSGVTAPIGDAEAMARRIAWLAEDRARLAELGAEAYRRVAQSQSIDRVLERYAALFDRVMELPTEPGAGSAGATTLEPYWWACCARVDALDHEPLTDELLPHLERLRSEGRKRIAIYGCGRHTQWRAGAFERDDPSVVGFIDDDPPPSGECFGLPVVPLDRARDRLHMDAVLVSSELWESEMARRAVPLEAHGVVVRRMYAGTVQAATV